MTDDLTEKPPASNLPKYLREPLEKQSPEQLKTVVSYATELAEWKRRQRQEELDRRREEDEVDDEELESLEERGISTSQRAVPIVRISNRSTPPVTTSFGKHLSRK